MPQEPVKVVTPEVCNYNHLACRRIGCCMSCNNAEYITLNSDGLTLTFTCDWERQPSAFHTDPARPLMQTLYKCKKGEPCFVRDNKPCIHWQSKFLVNQLTGEIFQIPSR